LKAESTIRVNGAEVDFETLALSFLLDVFVCFNSTLSRSCLCSKDAPTTALLREFAAVFI
jgi:hypothetical protein